MNSWIDMFIHQWPGMLLIAGIVGSILAWLMTRDARKKTTVVYDQMINAYDRAIEAKETLASDLKVLNEQRLAAANVQLETMTRERNQYRDSLHVSNNQLNAAQLESAELKARPNVDELFKLEKEWHEQREQFYLKISDSQERMVESQAAILNIVREIEEKLSSESEQHRLELRAYTKVSENTALAMEALVALLTQEGILGSKMQQQISDTGDDTNSRVRKMEPKIIKNE